jgi:mannose/fructose/N-acetylgalactosamine-specific phosphotransferase system component IIB
MAIVLFRVDDRLTHGQVVVGWGRPLGINRIVLVDEQVAGSAWEQHAAAGEVSRAMIVREQAEAPQARESSWEHVRGEAA